MKKRLCIPHFTQADKLLLVLLAVCFLAPNLAVLAMDAAADRAVEEDKPQVEIVEVASPIDCTPLIEAVEAARAAAQADPYDETIPLDRELQAVLREACEEHGVPVSLALGLIEEESRFQPEADNGLCYGLCQLNKRYYPDDFTPAENIQAGVGYLGELLNRYDGDTQAALTAFNAGHDTGDRRYAKAVLDASEKWGCG